MISCSLLPQDMIWAMNLNDYVTRLETVDDRSWFLHCCHQYCPENRRENRDFLPEIETAAQNGRSLARAKRPSLNGSLKQAMEREGLTVQFESPDLVFSPEYFELAFYLEPATVCVNTALIESILRSAEQEGFSLPGIDWADVFLAHEYAHFLAVTGQTLQCYQQMVRISKGLSGKEKSRLLPCLDEIFAMSFAKELLKMDISPWLFNFLALWKIDREKALALFQNIICAE